MPAHVTHRLFAEDSLRAAFGAEGDRIFREFGPFLTFGAQGPDFFYHNQRTKPSGLPFGKMLHRGRYGTMVRALVERSDEGVHSPEGAFTLGFVTHAVLDRRTHPFIIYFSGWVEPRDPSTDRYYLCHAFFERIIDTAMLERRRGLEIGSYDFLRLVQCGREMPDRLAGLVAGALCDTFPKLRSDTLLTLTKVRNAYRDTIGFYGYTNPPDRRTRELARELDLSDGARRRRRLALFHPYALPDGIDFLNDAHREWVHPSFRELRSTESFEELYDRAVEEAVPVLRVAAEALSGAASAEAVEEAVGNRNLNDGRSTGVPAPSRYSDPLPLPELLESMYRV